MSDFNICGVLVHARPGKAHQVGQVLEQLPGVEIHSLTDNDRLVITIEGETRSFVADTMSDFHKVEHVLSTAMVYQYSDLDTEQEMSA